MGFNKRAQGLSINAIILIVLGLVVLVMMILGFTLGWSGIKSFIKTDNADTIVTACSIACSTNGQNDFCDTKRQITKGDEELNDVTCNYLAKKKSQFKVETCSSISCSNIVFVEANEKNLLSNYCTSETKGKTVQALVPGGVLVSYNCPST